MTEMLTLGIHRKSSCILWCIIEEIPSKKCMYWAIIPSKKCEGCYVLLCSELRFFKKTGN